MKITFYIISIICLIGFGLTNAVSHRQVRKPRAGLQETYHSPKSQLPVNVIKLLAGEFRGIVADYLLLEVGAFIGSNRKGSFQDYQNIYLALKQSLALDPYFQQTYIYVQGTLPWDAVMPDKAIELLEISARHRTWDWLPEQYMGFNYYYFFNDYSKASEVFLEAAKAKSAPPIMAHLGSRFALKSHRTEAAIALLQSLLNDQQMDAYTQKEIEDRLTALRGVWILEQAIRAYRNQHGAYPATLAHLTKSLILKQLPANPYAENYLYDPETGSVAFDRVQ